MKLPTARKAAIAMVHRIDPKIRVDMHLHGENPKVTKYTFDGKRIVTSGGTGFYGALHDVVHYLVASPGRRKCIEFGLGMDPYRFSYAQPKLSRTKCDDEEGLVCDLQIGLLMAMGFHEEAKMVAGELYSDMPSPDDIRRVRKYRPSALSKHWWQKVIKACKRFEDENDLDGEDEKCCGMPGMFRKNRC